MQCVSNVTIETDDVMNLQTTVTQICKFQFIVELSSPKHYCSDKLSLLSCIPFDCSRDRTLKTCHTLPAQHQTDTRRYALQTLLIIVQQLTLLDQS